jgi:hypothetical protein
MRYMKRTELDRRAVDYLVGQIKQGRGLARSLEGVNFQDGKTFAFLPSADTSLAAEYETGTMRDETQEREAVEALVGYLATDVGLLTRPGLALFAEFADGAVTPKDAPVTAGRESAQPHAKIWLRGASRRSDDNEVWFVDGRRDLPAATEMLLDALWFPAVAALVEMPSGISLAEGEVFDHATFATLTTHPELVLVGGWDATNYLVWQPAPDRRGLRTS